jgi:hypothetical protein
MKKFVLLAFSLFSSVTLACTDFSGKYVTNVNETYSLTQNGCKSIQFFDDTESVLMIIDGQEYFIKEFDIQGEGDDQNINVKIYATGSFIGERLVQSIRLSAQYTNGTQSNNIYQSEIFLNQNRDIVNITTSPDGTSETSVDRRVN